MINNIPAQHKKWRPAIPPSKGATAYHDAVVNTSWHKENIDGLIKMAQERIKKGDVVIDFGAGTGASALYMLKKIKKNFILWLVDNSGSWLGKAYELLSSYDNVTFSLLEKTNDKYATLEETVGNEIADHIVSANTFHLIPNLHEAFTGIYGALKTGGTFIFQSGSIVRNDREKDILIIDNTVNMVHDIAISIVQTNDYFKKYRSELKKRIADEKKQRKFVFPDPRPVEHYIETLNQTGFKNVSIVYKKIKVPYKDWLNFLLVKRIQAGILPEIGGKDATPDEEKDRNKLIKLATLQLFDSIKNNNKFANKTSFTAEWIYVAAEKGQTS